METIDFNDVIRDPETISVVGGLLGNPLGEKENAVGDLNLITASGIYGINTNLGITNSPIEYGMLVVFKSKKGAASNGNPIVQLAFGTFPGYFIRLYWNDKWNNWKQINTLV